MNKTLAALLMLIAVSVSAQAANMTEVLTEPASKAVFAGNMKGVQADQGDQSGKETEDQFKARAKKVLMNPPPVTPAPAQKTK